jgi:diguanylate cyclase
MLSNCSRGGDYVFRLGGEEFLMLLVDTTAETASRVAEKIRREVADEDFKLPMDRHLKVTISIGLAMHNGHPDYQHTLRLADAALYQAKDQGRNRVVQAPGLIAV